MHDQRLAHNVVHHEAEADSKDFRDFPGLGLALLASSETADNQGLAPAPVQHSGTARSWIFGLLWWRRESNDLILHIFSLAPA